MRCHANHNNAQAVDWGKLLFLQPEIQLRDINYIRYEAAMDFNSNQSNLRSIHLQLPNKRGLRFQTL